MEPESWVAMEGPGGFGESELSDFEDRFRLSDLGNLARLARRRVVRTARFQDQPSFAGILLAHLKTDLVDLEVVEESWPSYDLVNVQVGLDAWLAKDGIHHKVVGMRGHRQVDFGLSDLLHPPEPDEYVPMPGNVARVRLPVGTDGALTSAVLAGVYLVTIEGLPRTHGVVRAALMVRAGDPESGAAAVQVHVVADQPGAATQIGAELRVLAVEHNVFRGQVLSFAHDMFGERASALQFHSRPLVAESEVILPAETMAAIRRQVVAVARHRDRLIAAGQHLKRGLLLYGPPGVGKTHAVRYLIGQLTDVTVVELSGDSLGAIGEACSVARTLQPAMIVVEDVDLIAEERGSYPGGSPLLFQLLNEMDGLSEDTDVVFLLTTNRAEVLEPALAARPGRVDQAIAIERPDLAARRRLFALYRGDLDIDESNLDAVLERTEGVTASFLKELLRRSALLAAEDDGAGQRLCVSAAQLDQALDELLETRNAMTRTLLGGSGG